MKKGEKAPAYLQLVRFDEERAESPAEPAWTQLSLFPLAMPSMLGLYALSTSSAETFVEIVTRMAPRYVVDVRVVPRFDFPRMTRPLVLSLFERISSRYIDASAALRLRDRRNACVYSGALSAYVNAILTADNASDSPGPLLFLLEDEATLNAGVEILPKTLCPRPRGGWSVHLFTERGFTRG